MNHYNYFAINQLKIMFFVEEGNEKKIEDSINRH